MCKDNNLFFYTVSADICFRDNNLFFKRKKRISCGRFLSFLSLKNLNIFYAPFFCGFKNLAESLLNISVNPLFKFSIALGDKFLFVETFTLIIVILLFIAIFYFHHLTSVFHSIMKMKGGELYELL